MKKRKLITEADKLKEAKAQATHFSKLADQLIAEGRDAFDRQIFAACINSWQSAQRVIHRIEMDAKLAKLKKEGEAAEREQYNRIIFNNE